MPCIHIYCVCVKFRDLILILEIAKPNNISTSSQCICYLDGSTWVKTHAKKGCQVFSHPLGGFSLLSFVFVKTRVKCVYVLCPVRLYVTDCSSNKEAKIFRKKNTFTYCANTLHSVILYHRQYYKSYANETSCNWWFEKRCIILVICVEEEKVCVSSRSDWENHCEASLIDKKNSEQKKKIRFTVSDRPD